MNATTKAHDTAMRARDAALAPYVRDVAQFRQALQSLPADHAVARAMVAADLERAESRLSAAIREVTAP